MCGSLQESFLSSQSWHSDNHMSNSKRKGVSILARIWPFLQNIYKWATGLLSNSSISLNFYCLMRTNISWTKGYPIPTLPLPFSTNGKHLDLKLFWMQILCLVTLGRTFKWFFFQTLHVTLIIQFIIWILAPHSIGFIKIKTLISLINYLIFGVHILSLGD